MTDYNAHEISILQNLYSSLDGSSTAWDVFIRVRSLLAATGTKRRSFGKSIRYSHIYQPYNTCMYYPRPTGMESQLKAAQKIFGAPLEDTGGSAVQIEEWIRKLERTIGKEFGKNDFKDDRLPTPDRRKAGIDISRRQYNKRFRLAVRLEISVKRIAREEHALLLLKAYKT